MLPLYHGSHVGQAEGPAHKEALHSIDVRAVWRWIGCSARSDTLVTTLQRNGLIGQLPDELGRLTKLQILRLGFNKLAFLLPRAWSGMSSLRFMDLRSNSLTGTLPMVGF